MAIIGIDFVNILFLFFGTTQDLFRNQREKLFMKFIIGLVLWANVCALHAQVDSVNVPKVDSLIAKNDISKNDPPKSVMNSSYNEFSGTYDKIKLESGDSLVVTIIAETQTEVAFKYPYNTMINKVIYGKIKEIIYKDGRVKGIRNQFPANGVGTEPDNLWRIVVITENEDDISGLKEIGPITARSEGKSLKTNIELLEKNARINLQKKAIRMSATKVLVKERIVEQAYGEIPFVEYEGIAYGAN